jgi:glycosyltransferase involved in cell wall biosynthesis
MKRVLFVDAHTFPALSVHHYTRKKWIELSKNLDEFHVLARAEDQRFHHYSEGKIHLHLVPKIGQKYRWIYLSGLYLFYLIPKYKIGLIMAQSAILGGLYASWASRINGIPLMTEIHGDEYFRYLGQKKWYYFPIMKMIRYVFKRSIAIRSLNKRMTEKLSEHGFSSNVIEIPNRVDLSVFNRPKTTFEIGKTLKMITVGRFLPPKNYENLIRCLAQSKLDFHLTLIGGGPLKDQYVSIIEELGSQNRFTLIDWLDQQELIDKIITSDIYVQYSVSEGMPRTILEAMSLQMPIVTSDAGSIRGIIEHSKNGMIVSINDCNDFLTTIEKLQTTCELREKIATNAYRDIVENYEWNNVFDQYRNVIDSIFKRQWHL